MPPSSDRPDDQISRKTFLPLPLTSADPARELCRYWDVSPPPTAQPPRDLDADVSLAKIRLGSLAPNPTVHSEDRD